MITLLIDKLLHLHNHVNYHVNHVNRRHPMSDNCEIICRRTRHQIMSKISSKFKVFAADADDQKTPSEPNADQTSVHNEHNVYDLKSREVYTQMKTMTIWESVQYLWGRNIDKNDPKYQEQFIKPGETGMDRIRLMCIEYFHGEDNPEMNFIFQSGMWGFLVGSVYGGIFSNQTATQDFIRRHNEFVFRGDIEAKRKIRDTMYIQFVRHGFRWGWRIGLFCLALSGVTTSAIAYRNNIYIRDCMLGGALVCSLWKAKLGLRAMAVSGLLGSIFGAFFGGSVKLMLWTFNTSVPEYRHWRHIRYRGYLEPEKYSDGSTEYKWNVDNKDPNRQPDYRAETSAIKPDS